MRSPYEPDPHKLTAVTRSDETGKGRLLTPEDRIDAAIDTIVQNDVAFEVMSVQPGTLPERGDKSFLLIRCRVAGQAERYSRSQFPMVSGEG